MPNVEASKKYFGIWLKLSILLKIIFMDIEGYKPQIIDVILNEELEAMGCSPL